MQQRTWTMAVDVVGRLHGNCTDSEDHDRCRAIKVREVSSELDAAYKKCESALAICAPHFDPAKEALAALKKAVAK